MEIKTSGWPLRAALPTICLRVSIFAFGEHYGETQRLDAVTMKNFLVMAEIVRADC